MHKTIVLLIAVILLNNIANAETRIPIKITKFFDGDTVEAAIDENKFSIRLIGIDCYETCDINRAYKQAYYNNLNIEEIQNLGLESKEYLIKLYKKYKNKDITFIFKGLDNYNRVLGIIYFGDLNVNEDLRLNGGCKEYKYTK